MANSTFAEDIQTYFDEQEAELGIKRHLAMEAVKITGDCINLISENDPGARQPFLPLEGIFELSGTPLGKILEEGLAFSIAATEDDSHWIQIHICTEGDDPENIGMVATMIRRDEHGRPEMFINGEWCRHFSYHGDKLDPVDCDKCQERRGCGHYQEMLAEEEAFQEWLETDDGKIQVILRSLPVWAQELLDDDASAERDMLASYIAFLVEHDLSFDETEWKKATEKTDLLCELREKSDTLEFSFVNRVPVLTASDEDHHGFAIRQQGDRLELCQFIDLYMLGSALDVEWWKEDYDPYWLNPVGTGTVKQMLGFEKKNLLRASDAETMYTIPLSLEKSVYLHDMIGKRFSGSRKTVERFAEKCGETEKKKAAEWITEMEKDLKEARKNTM